MIISFEKWHGCLNDFVVCTLPRDPLVKSALIKAAARLCQRNGGGIGADGLLLIEHPAHAPLPKLTIVNSDGSLARTCGNGIRCAAAYLASQAEEAPDLVQIDLGDQPVSCRFHHGQIDFVSVQMGTIQRLDDVPFQQKYQAAIDTLIHRGLIKSRDVLSHWRILNDHILIPVDSPDAKLALEIGPLFQEGDGINIHLIKEKTPSRQDLDATRRAVDGELAELYTAYSFERGAGATMACGSGACAIGAMALSLGFIDRKEWVGIDMPGGRLLVKQPSASASEPMVLAGPAARVFCGTFEL